MVQLFKNLVFSGEAYQHIVNGGIFAGTLTLCLSDMGIGSCVI